MEQTLHFKAMRNVHQFKKYLITPLKNPKGRIFEGGLKGNDQKSDIREVKTVKTT